MSDETVKDPELAEIEAELAKIEAEEAAAEDGEPEVADPDRVAQAGDVVEVDGERAVVRHGAGNGVAVLVDGRRVKASEYVVVA